MHHRPLTLSLLLAATLLVACASRISIAFAASQERERFVEDVFAGVNLARDRRQEIEAGPRLGVMLVTGVALRVKRAGVNEQPCGNLALGSGHKDNRRAAWKRRLLPCSRFDGRDERAGHARAGSPLFLRPPRPASAG